MKTRLLAIAFAALFPSLAFAQIQPSGNFTPGHALKSLNTKGTAAGDAGGANGGPPGVGLTELGITNTGLPLCVNSGPTTLPYYQICLGANSQGGGLISYEAKNGATQLPLSIDVNGTLYPFPGQGNGNVLGPNTTVINDFACWNNTTGTLLKDCVLPAPPNFNIINVVDLGADPTGIANSFSAFKAAADQASNHTILVPPGTYNICTTQDSGYSNLGPVGILIKQQHDFTWYMLGANIHLCDAVTTGNTGVTYIEVDQSYNFYVIGGNGVGNQTGKLPSGDTVFVSANNNWNFTFDGQSISGDWQSDAGVAFDGFYDVHGTFSKLYALNVSLCYDMAFMQDVTFSDFHCTGKFQGGAGVAGVHIEYDTTAPPSTFNKTPFTITDSTNVLIERGYASGFNSGWSIGSGSGYVLQNNYWEKNQAGGGNQGSGGLIIYENGGPVSSIGHPPHDIQSIGETYVNNGHPTNLGGGIEIFNTTTTGGEKVSNVHIASSFIDNYDRGVDLTSVANASNLSSVGSTCSTPAGFQPICVDSFFTQVSAPFATVSSGSATSVSSNVPIAVVQMTLDPGNWIISGWIGNKAAAGATVTELQATVVGDGACTTPVLPTPGAPAYANAYTVPGNPLLPQYSVGPLVLSVGAPTPICVVGMATFSGGTNELFGSIAAFRN